MTAALALATCLGIGYAPVAPGTFGSLAGLAIWALLPGSLPIQSAAIFLSFAAGAWAGSAAERHFRATDPGPVVIDELMGMLVTLFMNPVGWWGAMLGFLWFRFFDIVKPYPANRLERLPGGVGIMADDFVAAVYANVALRISLALWHLGIGQSGNWVIW
jgi:phosphatidylglycerophosphatase A